MRRVYLNRGLPGSGKTFRAHEIQEHHLQEGREVLICSSDDFFINESMVYVFNRDRLYQAHVQCQDKFRQAIKHGVAVVIVDNTNLSVRECCPYVAHAVVHGYEVIFLEPRTPWAFDLDELVRRNLHGISRATLARMLTCFVPNMTIDKALGPPEGGPMTPDEEAANAAGSLACSGFVDRRPSHDR
jgi:hypothetical protein